MRSLTLGNTRFALAAAVFTAGMLLGTLQAEALTPADYPIGSMANGIADSRHNLGSKGRVLHNESVNEGVNGTTEICVFCHTPHHGSTNAPLWNKGAQNTSYTAYGTTVAGTNIADSDIGGATLACLSCHDGVNTFDTLVNAPGKGNAGANNTTATNFGFKWSMANDGGTGVVGDDHFATGLQCTFCHDENAMGPGIFGKQASGGSGNPSIRLTIGTDLTNDHPVSVSYQANKASLRPTDTLITSILMTTVVFTAGMDNEGDSSTTTANRWSVKGYINGDATISDLLRGSDNKVECSSCHDPHFSNKSWDEVESNWKPATSMNSPYWCANGDDCSDGNFLRRVGGNSVSGVCRTCHAK